MSDRYRTATYFARSEGVSPGKAVLARIEIEDEEPFPLSDYGSVQYGPWIEAPPERFVSLLCLACFSDPEHYKQHDGGPWIPSPEELRDTGPLTIDEDR